MSSRRSQNGRDGRPTRPYRAQLLEALGDGRWHDASELDYPQAGQHGLEAWIGILRASGHRIEQKGHGGKARYRLVDG